MRRFPGRFINEIDEQLDWFRFLRAVEAENIELVEQQRQAQMSGQVKELRPETWTAILEHDRLAGND